MMTGVAPAGFSPATNRVKAGCSGALSYGAAGKIAEGRGFAPRSPRARAGRVRAAFFV